MMHDIADETLAEILPMAKRVANALRAATSMEDYNILQVRSGPSVHPLMANPPERIAARLFAVCRV